MTCWLAYFMKVHVCRLSPKETTHTPERRDTMNHSITTSATFRETAQCPYCNRQTSVDLPADYRPVYASCGACGEKFIVERLAQGFHALTLEAAPCDSDPDCRELEMAGYDEE
jgi:hypothetical protein